MTPKPPARRTATTKSNANGTDASSHHVATPAATSTTSKKTEKTEKTTKSSRTNKSKVEKPKASKVTKPTKKTPKVEISTKTEEPAKKKSSKEQKLSKEKPAKSSRSTKTKAEKTEKAKPEKPEKPAKSAKPTKSTNKSTETTKTARAESAAPKRKASEAPEDHPVPKRKASEQPADVAVPKRQKAAPAVSNSLPTTRLDVYVFGNNTYGELGLGERSKRGTVLAPALNPNFDGDSVGVVHLVAGGIHAAALTHDNKILTWGANDEGVLGRDTFMEKKPVTDSDDEDDNEVEVNVKESTPTAVDASHFPENTVFTQLIALDSATFALTSTGQVYGWGCFRNNNGRMGFFVADKKVQPQPVLIEGVNNITKLAGGAHHVLALASDHTVYSWGCDEQHQLGRRRAGRGTQTSPLEPQQCALPLDIVDIAAGAYHSFALRKNGALYAWGSNNFGQTGIFTNAGMSDAAIPYPTRIPAVGKFEIASFDGGKDHSHILTKQGQCVIWGRIENKALGLPIKEIPEDNSIFDEYGKPRILSVPTPITSIPGRIVSVTTGMEHVVAVTEEGKAYSWGFNAESRTGQDEELEEVEQPMLLSNKHVDGKKLVGAALGGQFGIVLGAHGV